MTEAPSIMNLQRVVLTRSELVKFCDLLRIEVVDMEKQSTVMQPGDWLPYRVRESFNLYELACLLHGEDPERLSDSLWTDWRLRNRTIGDDREALAMPAQLAATLNAIPRALMGEGPGGTLVLLKKATGSATLQHSIPREMAQSLADALGLPWPVELGGLSGTVDAPRAEGASLPAPVSTPAAEKPQRKTWRDVAWAYVVGRLRTGKFSSAVELNHTLHAEAERDGSPFDKGEGHHRGSLWVREIAQPLKLKTIQNAWQELRSAAGLK